MAAISIGEAVLSEKDDDPGSPYLRRPLRSYEEVKRKHADRRRDWRESSRDSEIRNQPDGAKSDGSDGR